MQVGTFNPCVLFLNSDSFEFLDQGRDILLVQWLRCIYLLALYGHNYCCSLLPSSSQVAEAKVMEAKAADSKEVETGAALLHHLMAV